MARLYERQYSRSELLRRVGNVSQVAGIKRAVLTEGRQQGVEALFFKTGSGFGFTVLPGRGMDICSADYQGRSLCWHSAVGEVAPCYFEPEGLGWLRSFFGGLLTTCGLTYVGDPTVDPDVASSAWRQAIDRAAAGENQDAIAQIRRALLLDQSNTLGIHGRISNIPAERVSVDCRWQGDEYVLTASGTVRDVSSFGENLSLSRTVSTRLGESRLTIHDVVANEGHETTPHMILYHINAGFPVLDDGSTLVCPSVKARPRDEEAERGKEDCLRFGTPTAGFVEQVYYHDMAASADGATCAALVNRSIEPALAVYVRYNVNQLPRFIEWKMMGEGAYVVGMEPANCLVDGRDKERAAGTLQFLQPGETREYHLEIGVLVGDQIDEFEDEARRLAARAAGKEARHDS